MPRRANESSPITLSWIASRVIQHPSYELRIINTLTGKTTKRRTFGPIGQKNEELPADTPPNTTVIARTDNITPAFAPGTQNVVSQSPFRLHQVQRLTAHRWWAWSSVGAVGGCNGGPRVHSSIAP